MTGPTTPASSAGSTPAPNLASTLSPTPASTPAFPQTCMIDHRLTIALSGVCTFHAHPCQLLLAALPAHQQQDVHVCLNKTAAGQLSAMVAVLYTT